MDTEIDWYNITEGYDINVILNIFSFLKDVQGVVHIASHLIAQLNNEYKVLVKHAKQSEADRLLSVIRFLDIVRRLSDENMQRALDDANAKVDSLAAELASFQIKYSKLKENNSELEGRYNSLKSQCAQLENELYNLNHIKSEQKELRRVIFQLNQEIDNARKKYESCNNAWSNKYYTVEKECEKWKREYEEMKEECKVAGKCFTKSQAAIFLKAIGFLEEKLHDTDSWKVPDNKTVGKIANNIFGYSAEKSRQSLSSQTNDADITVIKNALKNKYPILEECLK